MPKDIRDKVIGLTPLAAASELSSSKCVDLLSSINKNGDGVQQKERQNNYANNDFNFNNEMVKRNIW